VKAAGGERGKQSGKTADSGAPEASGKTERGNTPEMGLEVTGNGNLD
jgi:hypothetical protein